MEKFVMGKYRDDEILPMREIGDKSNRVDYKGKNVGNRSLSQLDTDHQNDDGDDTGGQAQNTKTVIFYKQREGDTDRVDSSDDSDEYSTQPIEVYYGKWGGDHKYDDPYV